MISKSEFEMFLVNLTALVIAVGFHLFIIDYYITYNVLDLPFVILFDISLFVAYIVFRKYFNPKYLTGNSSIPCSVCKAKIRMKNWRSHMKKIHPIHLATLDFQAEQNLVRGHSLTGRVFNYDKSWQKSQKKW